MVVAEVNGKKIEKNVFDAKLDEYMAAIEHEHENEVSDLEMYEIKSYVIDKLIDDLLIVEYGEKCELCAEVSEVKTRFEELQNAFSSNSAFMDSLGYFELTVNDVYEDIKNNIVIEKVFDKEIRPNLKPVDDNTLRIFYEENKSALNRGACVEASHIFIKVDNFEDAKCVRECKSRIDDIHKKLLENEISFSDAAKSFSDCQSSSNGGELGVFSFDEVDEDFAKVVFTLKQGSFSKPFASDVGFHIALCGKKHENYLPPYDSIKKNLSEYIFEMMENDAMEIFLEKLRGEADIKIYEY